MRWQDSTNPGFVLAAEWVWRHYHTRLREIRSAWLSDPPTPEEYALDIEQRMEMSARFRAEEYKQLRDDCEKFVKAGSEGPYLIPLTH